MTATYWIQAVAAVLAANGLTAIFVCAAVYMTRHEKNGGEFDTAPWWVYIGLIVPPAFVAIGGYLIEV